MKSLLEVRKNLLPKLLRDLTAVTKLQMVVEDNYNSAKLPPNLAKSEHKFFLISGCCKCVCLFQSMCGF